MISNISNLQAQPAFQAHLDVRTAVKNSKRLTNIQELFAQKTSRYPNETLRIVPPEDVIGSDQLYLPKPGQRQGVGPHFLERNLDELMENLSDNEIAKKLVRFFKGLKLEGSSEQKLEELREHIFRLRKLAEGNTRRAALFREKGNLPIAERYETMTQQNNNKIEMDKEQIKTIREHFRATLDKISKNDPDLEYNADIVSIY